MDMEMYVKGYAIALAIRAEVCSFDDRESSPFLDLN
jgi:hypothetical protein